MTYLLCLGVEEGRGCRGSVLYSTFISPFHSILLLPLRPHGTRFCGAFLRFHAAITPATERPGDRCEPNPPASRRQPLTRPYNFQTQLPATNSIICDNIFTMAVSGLEFAEPTTADVRSPVPLGSANSRRLRNPPSAGRPAGRTHTPPRTPLSSCRRSGGRDSLPQSAGTNGRSDL